MIRRLALAILQIPFAFDFYQWLVGAPRCHRKFLQTFVNVKSGHRVLDIGCGVGAGLKYLPQDIDYLGVDISAPYIEKSKALYPQREFICADVTSLTTPEFPPFDVAYAFGVMHHLSDEQIKALIPFLQHVLKPGASFCTIDPCYRQGQSALQRFIIGQDRGEYVRDAEGYMRLFAPFGAIEMVYIDDVLNIPYTQCMIRFTPKV